MLLPRSSGAGVWGSYGQFALFLSVTPFAEFGQLSSDGSELFFKSSHPNLMQRSQEGGAGPHLFNSFPERVNGQVTMLRCI